MLLLDTWASNAILNRYCDLYVARVGGVPTRGERRQEFQRLVEQHTPNPFPLFSRLLRRDRWEALSLIYTPAPDKAVEAYRPWAQLAVAAFLAWVVVAIPISQLVDSLALARPLPADWLLFTVLRSISLVVTFSWAIRWILAWLNPESPQRWRLTCLGGAATGLIFFALFSVIG